MVDFNQFVTDLTTIGGGTPHMIGYAQNAQSGYIEAPTSTQQQDGVVPLDRLPAQWWNWFLNQATRRFSEAETYIEKAVEELDGVLDVMGVSPDSTDQTQLRTMFSSTYLQNYLPQIAESAAAFVANGTHANSLIVTDDDGNSGYSIKKIPYAPGLVVTTQITTAAKTITLPSNCPFDGQTIKVVFANGHEAANATDYMTLNSIPIVSNQNGTLNNLPIHEITAGTYSVLMANVTLEMYYTSNGFNSNPAWVVIGNPVVLSATDYTIYANGKDDDTNPLGTILARYVKESHYGYLYCDGRDTTGTSEELSTHYPRLYAYMGNTNILPDYREFALVGAEQNTTSTEIAADSHDVYVAGQGKNDCLQGHWHEGGLLGDYTVNSVAKVFGGETVTVPCCVPTTVYPLTITNPVTGENGNVRIGSVTRGKRKAVYFYIKAQ